MPVNTEDLRLAICNVLPEAYVEIEDQSSGCGESYTVTIVSEAFEGLTVLKRHRLINQLLKDQIAQMHAFSQKTYTPAQYKAYLEKNVARS